MGNEERDIIRIIEEQLRREGIHLDNHMVNDLGADSLDLLEMFHEIEEHFDIDISDDRAETISTVRDAVEIIGAIVNEGL